jgi:hypothetical protein
VQCGDTATASFHDPEVSGETAAAPAIPRAGLVEARGDEAVGDGIGFEETVQVGQVGELQRPDEPVALSGR